jgi:hypothetical protein
MDCECTAARYHDTEHHFEPSCLSLQVANNDKKKEEKKSTQKTTECDKFWTLSQCLCPNLKNGKRDQEQNPCKDRARCCLGQLLGFHKTSKRGIAERGDQRLHSNISIGWPDSVLWTRICVKGILCPPSAL